MWFVLDVRHIMKRKPQNSVEERASVEPREAGEAAAGTGGGEVDNISWITQKRLDKFSEELSEEFVVTGRLENCVKKVPSGESESCKKEVGRKGKRKDEFGSWITPERLEEYSKELRARPWGKMVPINEMKFEDIWDDPGVGGDGPRRRF